MVDSWSSARGLYPSSVCNQSLSGMRWAILMASSTLVLFHASGALTSAVWPSAAPTRPRAHAGCLARLGRCIALEHRDQRALRLKYSILTAQPGCPCAYLGARVAKQRNRVSVVAERADVDQLVEGRELHRRYRRRSGCP